MARIAALVDVLAALAPCQDDSPIDDSSTKTSALVHKVVTAIADDISAPWSLESLAAITHISPSYLSRLFNQHLGTPPVRYLARIRAEHAVALLMETDRAISDIAVTVGIPDANYFARQFRQHYGASPREYRRQNTTTVSDALLPH